MAIGNKYANDDDDDNDDDDNYDDDDDDMMIEKRLSHKCMSSKISRRGPSPSTMMDEEHTVHIPCNCAMQPHALSGEVSFVLTGVLSPRFSQLSPLPFSWH